MLTEIQNYTLECTECAALFPQRLEYHPSEDLMNIEAIFGDSDLKHYWRGPFCPKCGTRRMLRIVRDLRELKGENG